MIEDLLRAMVEAVLALGYTGIAVLMAVESSFIPFPSEVVLPPAGYLAATGRLDPTLVFAAGLGGSLAGALFNYWFAIAAGEPFLRRWGRYFFVRPENLDRAEAFFRRHGGISTFIGRLVPVIRQLISIPAGLARMPLRSFVLFTSLGAGIWCGVLVYVGWLIGKHGDVLRESAVHAYTSRALLFLLPVMALIAGVYIVIYRRKRGREGGGRGGDR